MTKVVLADRELLPNSSPGDQVHDMLSSMRIYRGRRSDGALEAVVEVEDAGVVRRLMPRPDIEGVKTATGFAWGYGGNAPKQLAIALLADAISDDVARDWHNQFRVAKITPIPIDQPWTMTDAEIVSWWKETSPGWAAPRPS